VTEKNPDKNLICKAKKEGEMGGTENLLGDKAGGATNQNGRTFPLQSDISRGELKIPPN